MNRLRSRLIAIFLAATLIPLAATWWITTSLLEHSLAYSATDRLDELSKTLEKTGREFYRHARETLRQEAAAGHRTPQRHRPGQMAPALQEFWRSGEKERFLLSGDEGERLNYWVRHGDEAWTYSEDLGEVRLGRLSSQYRQAREQVAAGRERDWRRGLTRTYLVLVSAVWLVSMTVLVWLAHRVSAPIRDRLAYLTQLAGWQALARKMAHEVKNSLTPIRLTMEELLARREARDGAFLEQAARIVVEEVESLERRVRAFSEFATEPPIEPRRLDVNLLVEERVAFLKAAHPQVVYTTRLAAGSPAAFADEDLVKSILTNLLENAAEAAPQVLCLTAATGRRIAVEIHDSGPGLSGEARKAAFEPTISFKKGGMGLGLSIAKRNALLAGGDILLVKSALGGAGFRVLLPAAEK